MHLLVAFVLAVMLVGLDAVPSYGQSTSDATWFSEMLDYLWVGERRVLVGMLLLMVGAGLLAYRAQLAADRHRKEADWGIPSILRRKAKPAWEGIPVVDRDDRGTRN